jgi:hypothetical protein
MSSRATRRKVNASPRVQNGLVTSKDLRQQERGADALVAAFVIEDGEEYAIH